MTPSRDVFVSIAVSKPEGLIPLPGALSGARRMAQWADGNGYLVVHIDDSNGQVVSVARVRTDVTAAIDKVHETDSLRRIVFYFAGHGAAQNLDDTLWLLTNWRTDSTEAIRVPNLQSVLRTYHPAQVSIIGDSCRVTHASFLDTLGNAVLFRRDETPAEFELDKFLATEAGEAAFMATAEGSQEAFCIFTEVLLGALEGSVPAAAIQRAGVGAVITSGAIAQHLKREVPLKASEYNVTLKPVPRPGFLEPEDIYVKLAPGVGPVVQRVNLGPPPVTKEIMLPAQSRDLAADKRAREDAKRSYQDELGQESHPTHYATNAGLSVAGTLLLKADQDFAAPDGVVVRADRDPTRKTWFSVGGRIQDTPMNRQFADILVRISDEHWAYIFAVQRFITALTVRDNQSVSVISREFGFGRGDYAETEEMVARMNARLITGDDAYDLAARIREGKHRNFVLGAIAAHLYDTVGDADNIRRMAYYYECHQQPIPFDVALLTGDPIKSINGRLVMDVRKVAKRTPRTEMELRHSYTTEETPARSGVPILGTVPLLRRAWTVLEIADWSGTEPRAWRDFLVKVRTGLTSAPFTTLRKPQATALANRIRVFPP